MDTRTVGQLRITTPYLDPHDLDPVTQPPAGNLVDALAQRAVWPNLTLDGAQIRLSHLDHATMPGAQWRNVTVYGCRFDQVELSGARLAKGTIERCEFVACRMSGLTMEGVALRHVIFEDCHLEYASWSEVEAIGPVALVNCILDHATLNACRLAKTVLLGCRLQETELADCDLRGADLRDNDLRGLRGVACLRGAVVNQVQLADLATAVARDLDLDIRSE
jgi:uncharacterized protein YjbI with pentapeptide repeats